MKSLNLTEIFIPNSHNLKTNYTKIKPNLNKSQGKARYIPNINISDFHINSIQSSILKTGL